MTKNFLNSSLKAFCKLQGNTVLIHGGGRKADFISNKMGISQKIIQGRRITDKEPLDIVVMTYAGMIMDMWGISIIKVLIHV